MPKQIPLAPKKRKWVKNRNVTLRGTRLAYNASQQRRYQKALLEPIRKMQAETKSAVLKLANSHTAGKFRKQQKEAAAMDESITTAAKKLMKSLMSKFDDLFSFVSLPIATTMVEGASKTSESVLKSSLKTLNGGLALNTGVVPEGLEDISKALINENVNLIKSIPGQYLDDVSGAVFRSITSGEGLADLVPQIAKYDGITLRRARMIAHDQTRKAYNFINKSRMQKVGVKQFEWVHSGGGRHPRPSHIAMSGNIYSFDDLPQINKDNPKEPPVYGIPGQAINCGCTMTPVVNFDDED